MNDIIYISLIIIIIIILVLLNSNAINSNIKNLVNINSKERFACLNNKKKYKQKINYPKITKIYKEDEDINYNIDVPLIKKPKSIDDNLGWRKFYKKNYNNDLIKHEDNFAGTIFRNYLDNLQFFQN